MSSVDALKVLEDPSLNDALLKQPSVADSFTGSNGLYNRKKSRRRENKPRKYCYASRASKKSEREDKYKNLKTLYDNYDAVVKRDYLKMIAALGNLATACHNIQGDA